MTLPFRERLERISDALLGCPIVQPASVAQLAQWVDAELGPGALSEDTIPYGGRRRRLQPLSPILHVVSGNTPHAAVQSLVRGLVTGAAVQWIKVPQAVRLAELENFVTALPECMRPALAQELPAAWLERAAAVAVFGADETIREFARRIQPWQRFLPHGNKVSFGWIRGRYDEELLAALTRDVVAFDQLGCLSPQFYLVSGDARNFARDLAAIFSREEPDWPPLRLTTQEAARLREFRDMHQLRAACRDGTAVWGSAEGLAWTVIFDPRPEFAWTPLLRTVVVKAETEGVLERLRRIAPFLSTIAVHPYTEEGLTLAVRLGAQRVCRAGAMQNPDWLWHHDGWPSLGAFLRYVDVEN
ncbi:MAG: hypothetical protein JO015_15770 [Verrucomicrobia bacterium]|nr:hypothetical protein [Verrucomicrobiota bacterium]